jgi:catechol 2,3-dioxygenase-like lactoylglutathione lyase family enzyme
VSACFCCGRDYPDDQLDRLQGRPEVAVCGGCLHWLLDQRDRGLVRAVPVLPADDIDASRAFWTAAGFGVEAYSSDFAIAEQEGVELHLVVRGEIDGDRGEAYLHVGDVDATHARWKAAGVAVSPLQDEPWGMREFSVVDPGGNRVRVGRSIPDSS